MTGYPATECKTHLKKKWKNKIRKGILFSSLIIAISSLSAIPLLSEANPQDPNVVGGNVSFSQPDTNTLHVNQSSQTAIINWNSFSISANETTHFNQPSASSIALNRVTGHDTSNILGHLSANGQIILSNPNGIFFGANSTVDVAGLIATTARISNKDFLNGNYRFIQDPNKNFGIVNNGTISVKDHGLVALVAPGVENNGVIQANLGKVVLASGTEFTIVDTYGDQLIQFATNSKVNQTPLYPDGTPMRNAVRNHGTIVADGGKILMTARTASDVVENVVNMDGVVQARSVSQQNGEIILAGNDEGIVNVSGTVDASGKNTNKTGGKIQITGNKVGLFDTAVIDASGDIGGGTILIGGDYQGKNSNISNAQYTYVAPNVKINADAITNGNGGKIILWADIATRFYGNISAQGGSQSGNGGFVETSGKDYLDVQGTVDTSAPYGNTGTWLLDPSNLTIATAGQNLAGGSFGGGNPNIFSGATGAAIIAWNTITTNLGSANVIITTTGTAGQLGDITIQDSVSYNSTNSLTFLANNNFIHNAGANVTNNGTGSINIFAGWNGGSTSSPVVTPGTGNIILNSSITTNGSGNAIVLAAGQSFINNVGSNVLNPGTGRWIIYSANPANNNFNGLVSSNQAIWNQTFSTLAPTNVPSGNRYVFSIQPTITFTTTSINKNLGDDLTNQIAKNFNATGFVNAATHGNVFTQDTLANTTTGSAITASEGTRRAAAPRSYTITIDISSVTTMTGYAKTRNEIGTITVSRQLLSRFDNNIVNVLNTADADGKIADETITDNTEGCLECPAIEISDGTSSIDLTTVLKEAIR